MQNQSSILSKIEQSTSSHLHSKSDFRSASSIISGMLDPMTSEQMAHNLIIEKLKGLMKTSAVKDLKQICHASDQGKATSVEFKNSMKRLGLLSKEVDRLVEVMVCNEEGLVDLEKLNARILKLE